MKHLGIIFCQLILYLFFIPISFAATTTQTTSARVVVPLKATVSKANWSTTITLCNTTANPVPLKDVELSFNYGAKINGSIWGDPWTAWKVASHVGSQIMLLGGTPWTAPLQPDPNCTKPMTIIWSSSPTTPLPTGPFVFKSEGAVATSSGKLHVEMQATPATGVGNPQVTVTGMGSTTQQVVTWGGDWLINNLVPGSYKVTSSPVDNGTQFFQADPVNVTVNANAIVHVPVTYKAVTSPRGKINVTMQAAPASGVGNPEVTISGMGATIKQIVTWGTQWEASNLVPGSYTVSSSPVDNGTDFFQAAPVNATVSNQVTTNVSINYTRVLTGKGNLTISLQSNPATGLPNPEITVAGMGTTMKQIVNWGTQWQLTNINTGAYTVSGNTINNGTDSYQATPVNATVNNSATSQVSLTYNKVQTGRPSSWNNIKHVVIIVFENTNANNALAQPYMKSVTERGAYASAFHAVTHPSQPNYIAMIAGSTLGVDTNDNVNLDGQHIGDLFDAKGLSWKAYAEDLPTDRACYLGSDHNAYARKHEPFISFKSVQSNPAQCSKIVNASQFFTDVAAHRLPTFSFYVPNENNDGHDTGVEFADRWLQNTFGPIFNDPSVMSDTLFVLTFDEDEWTSVNRIYTSFIGAGVKPGSITSTRYNFYNLMKTIEEIFFLGDLGRGDRAAQRIDGIWLP